jgi:hypothetical protein
MSFKRSESFKRSDYEFDDLFANDEFDNDEFDNDEFDDYILNKRRPFNTLHNDSIDSRRLAFLTSVMLGAASRSNSNSSRRSDDVSFMLGALTPTSLISSMRTDDPVSLTLGAIAPKAIEKSLPVVEAPTVGMFNILPPQLLRRSKGEVKITNTNLQKDSSKEPVEVLLSTITPTYNKEHSNIFPKLFTVVDKIFDKIVSCPDLNAQNDKILDLIKMVQDKTADLES